MVKPQPFDRSPEQNLRNIAAAVRGEIEDMKASVQKTPGKACMHAMNTAFALIELHKQRPNKKSARQMRKVALELAIMMTTFMKIGGRISFTDPPENKDGAAGAKQAT